MCLESPIITRITKNLRFSRVSRIYELRESIQQGQLGGQAEYRGEPFYPGPPSPVPP